MQAHDAAAGGQRVGAVPGADGAPADDAPVRGGRHGPHGDQPAAAEPAPPLARPAAPPGRQRVIRRRHSRRVTVGKARFLGGRSAGEWTHATAGVAQLEHSHVEMILFGQMAL